MCPKNRKKLQNIKFWMIFLLFKKFALVHRSKKYTFYCFRFFRSKKLLCLSRFQKNIAFQTPKMPILRWVNSTNHLNNWDPIWSAKSVLNRKSFGGVPFVLPRGGRLREPGVSHSPLLDIYKYIPVHDVRFLKFLRKYIYTRSPNIAFPL